MISQPYFTLLLGLFALSLWPQTKGWMLGPDHRNEVAAPQASPNFAVTVGLACMLVGEALRWPDFALHLHGGLWVLSLALGTLSREKHSAPEKVSRVLMSLAVGLAAIGSMGMFNWLLEK
jgi:hypothetical protein